jgi:hypothetical protein
VTVMQMGQGGQDFEAEREATESIKIERNSRGVNWSFRLKREPGEGFNSWVERCAILDGQLRERFGRE